MNTRMISPPIITVCLLLCGLVFAPAGIAAHTWYVATNGTPSGSGTLSSPYDLATALSGAVGGPGDVFWLRGGTYVIGHIDTKIQGAPGQPITFQPRPGEQPRVNGSLSFFESAGYVVLRDFELFSSDANRVSTQTNAGFNPTDINPITGIASYSPNMSFINLIMHDETREGIYISHEGSNNLIYGCVVFNTGWRSPDNAEGHGIYVQGSEGTREVADNIVFNNAGVGLHIYANDPGQDLASIILDGNVAFNAGAIQSVRDYRDWIVGVDAPSISADQIVFKNNLGYPARGENDAVQIGRQGVNGNVAILNNYLPQGLELNNWTSATVTGNLFAAQPPYGAVNLNQTMVSLAADWNHNSYAVLPAGGGFLDNANPLSFAGWRAATGFDSNSAYRVGSLTGTTVFIRPNQYQPGRANIIVYNRRGLRSVSVNVSQVLPRNTAYEVRNAQNYFGRPVVSGIFRGQPLILPMTGLQVAVPNGSMRTPPSTAPMFNVFVLLPR